jgi:hypothetical protein
MEDRTDSIGLATILETVCLDYLAYKRLAKTLHSSVQIAKAKKEMRGLYSQRIHSLFGAFRERIQNSTPKTLSDLDPVLHLLQDAVIEATR